MMELVSQRLKLKITSINVNMAMCWCVPTVRPPRVRPALSTPPRSTLRPPTGVRRHGGTAGHVCLVQVATGQWGGIHSGVLPAWPLGGRGVPRLHAVWWRTGRRRPGWWHLQGASLSTLLLLLMLRLAGRTLPVSSDTCVDSFRARCK